MQELCEYAQLLLDFLQLPTVGAWNNDESEPDYEQVMNQVKRHVHQESPILQDVPDEHVLLPDKALREKATGTTGGSSAGTPPDTAPFELGDSPEGSELAAQERGVDHGEPISLSHSSDRSVDQGSPISLRREQIDKLRRQLEAA